MLNDLGRPKFIETIKNEKNILYTDTTFRDAHQSLLATRVRTIDMLKIAESYAKNHPELFSLEMWGGATFDVALRFLHEDPWQRLQLLREAIPNTLFQMLIRGANAVGYTAYPDNLVEKFIEKSWEYGIDVFRVFDSLNWVDNMRVAMDAVIETGALCEGALCYTGDLFDPKRSKYDLKYYVGLAKQLEKAGAHILGIKDMSGVCKPRAAHELVRVLKQEVGLPIHFHTHDTSGISAASVLAAIDAGCDAVDGALDSMSGLTSQPNLGSIAAALQGSARDPGVDLAAMQAMSHYWEGVRRSYVPFEADIRAGTSDVYNHEMPGGQYTNLREQARAMGLEHRWPDVSKAYADVNVLFGDIVKVTPTSKVVGDMALFMVANDLKPADVSNPEREIAFPESVISLFKGELGFPPDGFPKALESKVLRGEKPMQGRAGDHLPDVDLEAKRAEAEHAVGRHITDTDLASYLMYPKVFKDYAEHRREFSDVSLLPTSPFFYGLLDREEIAIDIDKGKTLVVRQTGRSDTVDEEGKIKVFFELNGQPRTVRVPKAGLGAIRSKPKAEEGNIKHVGAPMPGMVVTIAIKAGQKVKKGDPLLSIEAMKMETMLTAERDATVHALHVRSGETINAKDLLLELS